MIAGACWQDNRLDIAFLESGEREMGKREEEEKRRGGGRTGRGQRAISGRRAPVTMAMTSG